MNKLKVVQDANCSSCVGSCCSGVYGTHSIIHMDEVAAYLGISESELKEKYLDNCGDQFYDNWRTRLVDNMCSFYKDGCSINSVKPFICAHYPMNGSACRSKFVSNYGETTSEYSPFSWYGIKNATTTKWFEDKLKAGDTDGLPTTA